MTNTGNITLTGVTVKDPLTGTDVLVGDLAVGETKEVLATYAITQDDLDDKGGDDGDIDNTATADSNETGPEDDSEEVPLVYNPLIDLEKLVSLDGGVTWHDADLATGPEVDIAGGDAIFRIELTNTGNISLTELSLSDVDSQFGDVDLSGYTLTESISDDGILEVGETAFMEYTLALTVGQHINTASVSTAEGAEDSDMAHYYGLINEGPGVRTPGGWGESFKLLTYWDGIEDNEIDSDKDEFADQELTYDVDSNGDGIINGDDEFGLLIGDYNKDGITNDGETTIFISHEDALALVQSDTGANKHDKRDDVARQTVATWLNYLAGNELGEETGGDDVVTAHDWLDEAVDWLLEYADREPDGGDGTFDFGGRIVRARDAAWKSDGGGKDILNALDEYNNDGTVDDVMYAHDADDSSFSLALSIYSADEFNFA